ncbi:ankyrin repeat domain-containing protein [Paeniglutamicibacter sp. R2-26]|uniref:ankyrin repeat domain-containing protein n=1 Tax=Paeniglutamicibacter sp. R2-26 TaxID=3144417 RepID=UPI003EE65392
MRRMPAVRKPLTCLALAAVLGLGACGIPHSGSPGSVAPATPSRPALNAGAAAVLGEALIHAATVNDTAEVSRLLEAGAPLEYLGEDERTPLLAATRANSIEAARELMVHGANVNTKDALKDSAFLYAGAAGLTEILGLALEHGADVHAVNRNGDTALIPACKRAYVATVEFLVDTDIDLDHVNDRGLTCLLEAVVSGDGSPPYQDVVEMLVDEGAKLDIADPQGKTALDHARKMKQDAVVRLLTGAVPPVSPVAPGG